MARQFSNDKSTPEAADPGTARQQAGWGSVLSEAEDTYKEVEEHSSECAGVRFCPARGSLFALIMTACQATPAPC